MLVVERGHHIILLGSVLILSLAHHAKLIELAKLIHLIDIHHVLILSHKMLAKLFFDAGELLLK